MLSPVTLSVELHWEEEVSELSVTERNRANIVGIKTEEKSFNFSHSLRLFK